MTGLDFAQKITSDRPYGKKSPYLDSAVESDRGRIINSAAIRRLQQKTQVFPLERNAAVRSRLTHSLEVQQVGRYICQQIRRAFSKQQNHYGYLDLEREIESLVEMACLMHDIGNPPFGHFGEKAINEWFKAHIDEFFCFPDSHLLAQQMKVDLQSFEGNAQAIRLISSLLQLNLTYSQAAGIVKYTRPAYLDRSQAPPDKRYLMKKPGYYLSEQGFIEALYQTLSMAGGCRHPLSYIMEAADDIAYCCADIEDAVEKRILSVDKLCELLLTQATALGLDIDAEVFLLFNERHSFSGLLSKAKGKINRDDFDKDNRFFVNLRVSLNHILTNHAVTQFIANLPAVFHGTFDRALLEDGSQANLLVETFKQTTFLHVFNDREVELLELRGYQILQGLLSVYQPLLMLSRTQFSGLVDKDVKIMKHWPLESRLTNKLSGKHKKAYKKAINEQSERVAKADLDLWEKYYRCRLLLDYVSGMTDHYALDEYKSLTVS